MYAERPRFGALGSTKQVSMIATSIWEVLGRRTLLLLLGTGLGGTLCGLLLRHDGVVVWWVWLNQLIVSEIRRQRSRYSIEKRKLSKWLLSLVVAKARNCMWPSLYGVVAKVLLWERWAGCAPVAMLITSSRSRF
jgi:hypothetical protein